MHINDFLIVARDLRTQMDATGIINLYDQLRASFQNAASNPGANYQRDIRKRIEEINSAQISFNNLQFSKSQNHIFNTFNKDRLLGRDAVDKLNHEISQNVGSYSALAGVATNTFGALSNLRTTLLILETNINPFINTKLLDLKEEEDIVTIVFKNNASVENLESLQERAKQWKLILQWLKCVQNAEDFEIISFEDGSCKITLKNVRDGVVVVGALITFALTNYNTYLDIQIKQNELEKIRNPGKEISQTITLPEETFNKMSEDVATLFLNKHGITVNQNDYSECHTNITNAAKFVLNFIDDGGEVEFSSESKKDPEIASIQNYFEKIKTFKALEGKDIQLLPPLNSDSKLEN